MSDPLEQYIKRMRGLAATLSGSRRKSILRRVSRAIQKARKESIRHNVQPDGSPMAKSKKNRDYLEGYRKLRKNEKITIGREFIYDGPETIHAGEIRRMVTLKTRQTDARYGTELRYWRHTGKWYNRSMFDPDYVHGFATDRSVGGVSKFDRSYIYVKDKTGRSSLKEKLMFNKIHQYRFLKARADAGEAVIGFWGRVGSIAAAHQYGKDTRPERHLLGFSQADYRLVEEIISDHLEEHEH